MSDTQVEILELNEWTPADSDRLKTLENTIKDNLAAFFKVGLSLCEIRDSKLYRRTHPTFEKYCREKFYIARGTAYQYIESAMTMKNLSQCPQIAHKPEAESHIRPLAGLSPEDQVTVWKVVEAEASEVGARITAALVARVATQLVGKKTNKAANAAKARINESAISKELKEIFTQLIDRLRLIKQAEWQGVDRKFLKRKAEGVVRFISD